MKVDIGIIGGGVAGSGLALVLAQAGLSVAVVEREAEFRDRIRGEAIHPWGTTEVDRLGLRSLITSAARGRELPVWRVYRGREQQDPVVWAKVGPGAPPVLSVRHVDLQNALIAAAAEAGATVYRPATVDLQREHGSIRMHVRTADGAVTIEPRLLVGADGSHSATRTWLGGRGERDPIHHFMAGGLYHGVSLDPDAAHHASGPGGFGMIFPQTEGLARVYFACHPSRREELADRPAPQAIIDGAGSYLPEGALDGAEAIGPAGYFPNADIVATVTHGPGAVLIGDAAGANDPSLGHGLALTFRDIRGLRDLLLGEERREEIPAIFAADRARYYGVLREHAMWTAELATGAGEAAQALRERVARAREIDPTAGGFAGIFAFGPDGLVADEAARRHFLGEDLD